MDSKHIALDWIWYVAAMRVFPICPVMNELYLHFYNVYWLLRLYRHWFLKIILMAMHAQHSTVHTYHTYILLKFDGDRHCFQLGWLDSMYKPLHTRKTTLNFKCNCSVYVVVVVGIGSLLLTTKSNRMAVRIWHTYAEHQPLNSTVHKKIIWINRVWYSLHDAQQQQ